VADKTAIEWTDATFNPWWGCTRVSPACAHCYADTLARRYGHHLWDEGSQRRFFSDQHWAQPRRWNRQAERGGRRLKVFCASMADVFEDHRALDLWRQRLWALIEETPLLDWQLLTKRPENVAAMAPWGDCWPENVWLGTSLENGRHTFRANELPASIRFISAEPLLGSLFLNGKPNRQALELDGIDWVIAGGESGPRFRSVDLEWVRELRDACLDASIPFFYKQQGGRTSKADGRTLDGRTWSDFPLRLPVATAAGATAVAS